jgi:hypothetical protein
VQTGLTEVPLTEQERNFNETPGFFQEENIVRNLKQQNSDASDLYGQISFNSTEAEIKTFSITESAKLKIATTCRKQSGESLNVGSTNQNLNSMPNEIFTNSERSHLETIERFIDHDLPVANLIENIDHEKVRHVPDEETCLSTDDISATCQRVDQALVASHTDMTIAKVEDKSLQDFGHLEQTHFEENNEDDNKSFARVHEIFEPKIEDHENLTFVVVEKPFVLPYHDSSMGQLEEPLALLDNMSIKIESNNAFVMSENTDLKVEKDNVMDSYDTSGDKRTVGTETVIGSQGVSQASASLSKSTQNSQEKDNNCSVEKSDEKSYVSESFPDSCFYEQRLRRGPGEKFQVFTFCLFKQL